MLTAYPLAQRLSRLTPQIKWEKGFSDYFQRVYNVSKELMGERKSDQEIEAEISKSILEEEQEILETKKKHAAEAEKEYTLRAKYNKAMADETRAAQAAGKEVVCQ